MRSGSSVAISAPRPLQHTHRQKVQLSQSSVSLTRFTRVNLCENGRHLMRMWAVMEQHKPQNVLFVFSSQTDAATSSLAATSQNDLSAQLYLDGS